MILIAETTLFRLKYSAFYKYPFLSPWVGVVCRLKKRSVRTFDQYILYKIHQSWIFFDIVEWWERSNKIMTTCSSENLLLYSKMAVLFLQKIHIYILIRWHQITPSSVLCLHSYVIRILPYMYFCRWPDVRLSAVRRRSQNVARLLSDLDGRWSTDIKQKWSSEVCIFFMWMRVVAKF